MRNFQPIQMQEASNQPSQAFQESDQLQTTQKNPSYNGEHLDAIPIEDDFQGDSAGAQGFQETANEENTGSGKMSREEFHQTFCFVCEIAGTLTKLESVKTPASDEQAQKATYALYDTAEELGWNWLLSPGGKWAERAIVIGMFGVVKVSAIKEELLARQAKDITPEEKTEPKPKQAEENYDWVNEEKQPSE